MGTEFSDYFSGLGCLVHFTDANSPWQAGRTGRAGQGIKEQVEKVILDCSGGNETNELVLELWDEDTIKSDDFAGEVRLSAAKMLPMASNAEHTLPLTKGEGKNVSELKIDAGALPAMTSMHSELSSHSTPGQTMPSAA